MLASYISRTEREVNPVNQVDKKPRAAGTISLLFLLPMIMTLTGSKKWISNQIKQYKRMTQKCIYQVSNGTKLPKKVQIKSWLGEYVSINNGKN